MRRFAIRLIQALAVSSTPVWAQAPAQPLPPPAQQPPAPAAPPASAVQPAPAPAPPPAAPATGSPAAPAPAAAAPSPAGPPPPLAGTQPVPGAAPVTPPPAGYPPGTVVVYEPAPPPPPPTDDGTWRNHDGFYLRMGIGVGYGRVKSTGEWGTAIDGSSIDMEAVYSGAGPAYELLIGGTPGGGVVVGGGFVGQELSDPKIELNGEEVDNDGFDSDSALGMVLVGPFVDWFPNPRGGAHVGAMVGVAAIGLSNGDQDDNESSTGWGGSLWGGYDFWVANQWSLGAEGRFGYLSTHRDFGDSPLIDADLDDRGLTFELLFTALYH